MPFVSISSVAPLSTTWLWANRLPIGELTLMDGDPGLGKSLVSLDLAARVTRGDAFPDGLSQGPPRSVVLMNAEDGLGDTVRGRLVAASADLERVEVFQREPGSPFFYLPDELPQIESVVLRCRPALLVIDPIMCFLSPKVNLCCDRSVRAALAPLANLA